MRLCRFNGTRLGWVDPEGEKVLDVSEALDVIPPQRWPLGPGEPLIVYLEEVKYRINELLSSAIVLNPDDLEFDSPIASSGKIICAPNNYYKHFEEAKADKGIHFGSEVKTIEHSGLFLKAWTSVTGSTKGVTLPDTDRRIDHEVELALVIGKQGRNIARDRALDHIAAYTIGIDMTIRGTEDRSWRKSFETFCPMGPWMVTADEIPDPDNLDLKLEVNGVTRQSSNTRALIFSVPHLIEVASKAYTLFPGDVIMTGTPEGVAAVQPGDVMDCWIEKIGNMRIPVHGPDAGMRAAPFPDHIMQQADARL